MHPIFEGTDLPQLHRGPGHWLDTALPGEAGNAQLDHDEGAKFSITHPGAGTYSYICGIHNYMAGSIVVK